MWYKPLFLLLWKVVEGKSEFKVITGLYWFMEKNNASVVSF